MRLNIINGPNLNLLGVREKNIYGEMTYENFCEELKKYSAARKISLNIFQTNIEGEIINLLHNSFYEKVDGIILNAGAFTHYSLGIRDAIASINTKVIEVHLSNIYSREDFRKKSVIAEVCTGQISGLGIKSYKLAIDFFCS